MRIFSFIVMFTIAWGMSHANPAPFGLHWFRRDLRITGNPALSWNWKQSQGRVLGFFCFDKEFLKRADFSTNRFQFFLHTLKALKEELNDAGGDLLVWDQNPQQAFATLFEKTLPARISWNRDYEPFARKRDTALAQYFVSRNVAYHTESDHLLIEPAEVKKGSDPSSPFQVFTPFQNEWMKEFAKPLPSSRLQFQQSPSKMTFQGKWRELGEFPDSLAEYIRKNSQKVNIPIPEAGAKKALAALKTFQPKLSRYGSDRDLPGVNGTSHFSIYFKNGSLTTAQAIAVLKLKPFVKKAGTGSEKFLSELVWREFYYHVLYHFPHVETRAFKPAYDKMKWENREDYFEAWKQGKTGFPIVDAGMRQLNQTGWMHNRVRMIVASFLTKDLLVDYRWGERYFMEKLLDGDLAPNNGGWQWSASTGCDAQPYFRIFNPVSQSERFDPKGEYLRQYLPELKDLDDEEIHFPSPLMRGSHYPQPIVEHDVQRKKALAKFAAIVKA